MFYGKTNEKRNENMTKGPGMVLKKMWMGIFIAVSFQHE